MEYKLATKANAAEKVGKVIRSCKTEEQLDNAQNYVDLFYERYIYPQKEVKISDGFLESTINNLISTQRKLIKKQL